MKHKEQPLQPQDLGSPSGHAAGTVGLAHDAELQLLWCGERSQGALEPWPRAPTSSPALPRHSSARRRRAQMFPHLEQQLP